MSSLAVRFGKVAAGCAAVVAAALSLASADAAPHRGRPARSTAAAAQRMASPQREASIGSFTPATADPRLAALFARGVSTGANFRFTPSTTPGSRRAVTVAIRARSSTRLPARGTAIEVAEATPALGTTAATPVAYNLGVAFGWQRFALSGDYTRLDTGLAPGGHEGVDLGLSYGRGRWSTRLAVGADRSTDSYAFAPDRILSLDVGGSYALTRNIDVTGGVRYRSLRERFGDLTGDDKRDAQSVYVGTAFRF